MQLVYLFVLLPLVVNALNLNAELNTVKKAFAKAKLAESLGIKFNPKVLLEMTFPVAAGEKPFQVTPGANVPVNATVIPPIFRVVGSKSTGPFVVTMLDTDAPTPQNRSLSEVRHILASNLYGVDFSGTQLLVNFTAAPSPWFQPAPPAGSDPHRYAILLFNQPADFNNQTLVNANTSIVNFSLTKFMAATKLGDPIGGTNIYIAPATPA